MTLLRAIKIEWLVQWRLYAVMTVAGVLVAALAGWMLGVVEGASLAVLVFGACLPGAVRAASAADGSWPATHLMMPIRRSDTVLAGAVLWGACALVGVMASFAALQLVLAAVYAGIADPYLPLSQGISYAGVLCAQVAATALTGAIALPLTAGRFASRHLVGAGAVAGCISYLASMLFIGMFSVFAAWCGTAWLVISTGAFAAIAWAAGAWAACAVFRRRDL